MTQSLFTTTSCQPGLFCYNYRPGQVILRYDHDRLSFTRSKCKKYDHDAHIPVWPTLVTCISLDSHNVNCMAYLTVKGGINKTQEYGRFLYYSLYTVKSCIKAALD